MGGGEQMTERDWRRQIRRARRVDGIRYFFRSVVGLRNGDRLAGFWFHLGAWMQVALTPFYLVLGAVVVVLTLSVLLLIVLGVVRALQVLF
jgi:hypothetical protein